MPVSVKTVLKIARVKLHIIKATVNYIITNTRSYALYTVTFKAACEVVIN